MDHLPDELAEDSDLAKRLVRPIQNAYLARIASHDPEIGDDQFTFGTGLWRSTWFFLEKEFGDRSHRPRNAFFLRFDDYDLYFYGDRRHGSGHRTIGGSSVQDQIIDVNAQYCFNFVETTSSNGRPNLVALHAGVSPIGLTRLFVGLPITHDDPNTAWRFLEPVYLQANPETPTDRGKSTEIRPFSDMATPDFEIHPEDEDSAGDQTAP